MPSNTQIKSRNRVRELAEVYTKDEQINPMLDLVGAISHNLEARLLEPACGNGNFLVAILRRKLETVTLLYKKQKEFEFYSIKALSSVYGVDICQENIDEAHDRIRVLVLEFCSDHLNTKKVSPGYWESVRYILSKNIVVGDMLNDVESICFTEFSFPRIFKIKQRTYRLADLISAPVTNRTKCPSFSEAPIKNYLELSCDH